jgi:hypothetical protein
MKGSMKSWLAIAMGVIILVADLYWTYTSYFDTLWLLLGIIIAVADVTWILIDWSFMKR